MLEWIARNLAEIKTTWTMPLKKEKGHRAQYYGSLQSYRYRKSREAYPANSSIATTKFRLLSSGYPAALVSERMTQFQILVESGAFKLYRRQRVSIGLTLRGESSRNFRKLEINEVTLKMDLGTLPRMFTIQSKWSIEKLRPCIVTRSWLIAKELEI